MQTPTQKYNIYESGRLIGAIRNLDVLAQIVAEVTRRDAKAAAAWAVGAEQVRHG